MFDWRYSEKEIHSGLFRKILSKKERKEGTVFRIGIDIGHIACENIRFSSLFAAGDVSLLLVPPRETSPAANSEEKRMFSQASIDNAKKLEVGDNESWTAILFVVARNLDENSS